VDAGVLLLILLLAGPSSHQNSSGRKVDTNRVQQIMISHYATGGPGQHLLPGLEEATSDDKSPVLVFILTVNND